jgi:hypothetical protein
MHNGGGALLVIVMVTLLRALWPRALEARAAGARARPPESAVGMVTLPRVDAPR